MDLKKELRTSKSLFCEFIKPKYLILHCLKKMLCKNYDYVMKFRRNEVKVYLDLLCSEFALWISKLYCLLIEYSFLIIKSC